MATSCAVDRSIAELADAGFAGLKLHPRLNGYDPLDEQVVTAIRAAGEHKLVVFLDTLFRQPGRATLNALDVVDTLAVRCPSSSLVLLHGGGPHVLAMSEVVAAHANLTLDISFTARCVMPAARSTTICDISCGLLTEE